MYWSITKFPFSIKSSKYNIHIFILYKYHLNLFQICLIHLTHIDTYWYHIYQLYKLWQIVTMTTKQHFTNPFSILCSVFPICFYVYLFVCLFVGLFLLSLLSSLCNLNLSVYPFLFHMISYHCVCLSVSVCLCLSVNLTVCLLCCLSVMWHFQCTEARAVPYWSNYGPIRLRIHDIVINKYFDLVIAGIIFLNVVSMALEHYGMVFVSEKFFKIWNSNY